MTLPSSSRDVPEIVDRITDYATLNIPGSFDKLIDAIDTYRDAYAAQREQVVLEEIIAECQGRITTIRPYATALALRQLGEVMTALRARMPKDGP